MAFDFEQSEIWQLALQFVDTVYNIAGSLPNDEEHNLKLELKRCATQVAAHAFKVSVTEQNTERAKFVVQTQRAMLETIAHSKIVERRQLTPDLNVLHELYRLAVSIDERLRLIREQCTTKMLGGREFRLLGATGS